MTVTLAQHTKKCLLLKSDSFEFYWLNIGHMSYKNGFNFNNTPKFLDFTCIVIFFDFDIERGIRR